MNRRALVACLAVIGAFLPLLVSAGAAPKPDPKPKPKSKPKPASEIYVILKARLYEVDDAFHNKLAKAKWLSKADLDELETKPPERSLFKRLEKEKPVLVGKAIDIDLGKEGVLLRATKQILCLPTPDRLQQGKKDPQTFDESFTLSARVNISADRRFVRARFLEKSLAIEAIEKVKVVVDLEGTEAEGEEVFAKEASISLTRDIPDGGSLLLPLHYRPRAVRKKGRWLVVKITPRIYIEQEERERRGQPPK